MVAFSDLHSALYKHLVNLFGGTPVYLDTYETGFGIDAARLEKLITKKTKLLLLNSPGNPTGRIFPKSELEAIRRVCAKHGITVVSDEIYRAFSYAPMTSMAEVYPDTVVLVGHSKTFGMTGWRLGYACGSAEIIQAMTKVQQYSFVCAPSVVQYAALACPTVDSSENIAAYRRKRDLMVGILSPKFELAPPDGAFYLWAKAPNGLTGDQFVDLAIKNNMLIIPGSVFSERASHFRICYTVKDEVLKRGAELLCKLADGVRAKA
jgi:aspartate/methionine/tyrosine aminotransferase